MSARLTADAVATALVAAYQYDGKDPRELLGSAPSVTILADAALVIKERFHLRSAQAAGLCCLARRSRVVAIKMGDAFACRKRDRRQDFIKKALAAVTPPPASPPNPSPVGRGRTEGAAKAHTMASPRLVAKAEVARKLIVVRARQTHASAINEAVSKQEVEARLARQKSWAPSPVDLLPIPPVVCGTKWTRDYIEERERIKALHRQAGRRVS